MVALGQEDALIGILGRQPIKSGPTHNVNSFAGEFSGNLYPLTASPGIGDSQIIGIQLPSCS